MKKITRIVGVDCKIGRKSRTGSTVTMSVPDEFIVACTEYYAEFNSGEEIKGKIRKIELNLIYEDDLMEDEKAEKMIVDIDDALTEVVEEVKKALEYCPKCDSEELRIGWKDDNRYHITCHNCETTVSGETIEDAETTWNTRDD